MKLLRQPQRIIISYIAIILHVYPDLETVLKFFHSNLRMIFEMIFQCEEEA